ncbi:MAG: DUF3822 family protein [Chitinophagaceae bacterium]
MVQRIVDIKTEGLSAFDKETRSLTVCLEYCSMVIALVDKNNKHWVSVEVLQCSEEDMEDIDELLVQLKQQSSLLNYSGLEAKIFIRTPNAIPVPSALAEDSKKLLQLQLGLQKTDIVINERVNDEITLALKTNGDWMEPFTGLFPGATFHTSLGGLINQTLNESRIHVSPILQTVFSNGLVEVVLAKNNQLLIAKCFRFNTVEDMNYQLLNICRQLNTSPAEVALRVQGLVAEGSPLHQSLLKYFADVQFTNAATADWGVQFKSIPDHYFTSLINVT